MNLQTEKLFLIEKILQISNSSTLKKVKDVLIKNQVDDEEEWNLLSAAEKEAIENGLKSLDEGNKIPLSEIKKEYSKWLAE